MPTKLFTKVALVMAAFVLGGLLQPFNHMPTFAQSGCQTFPETGKTVCGRFLEYWQNHGGLAQQGYPISSELQEVSDLNGKTYTVQYFERAVFEKHPENQPPNDVLLSQLGAFRYKAKYAGGEPVGGGAQPQLPSYTVGRFFAAMGFDGGMSIIVQRSLLSKRLSARVPGDPYYGLLGHNFSDAVTPQDAPQSDLASAQFAWVLLLNDKGNTVAVFTLIKEDGAWKIDDVEPNALNK